MWQRAACASYCTACTVDSKGERGASVGTLLAWLNALPEGLSLCVCLHVYVCTCKTEMYFEGKLNPAQTSYIQLFSFTCVNRVLGMYRKQGGYQTSCLVLASAVLSKVCWVNVCVWEVFQRCRRLIYKHAGLPPSSAICRFWLLTSCFTTFLYFSICCTAHCDS